MSRRALPMLRSALALVALTCTGFWTVSAYAGSALLSWTPPTTNVDGSPLVDLAQYRIAWGCSVNGQYPNSTTITAPASSYRVEGLPDAGTCYFVATALNSRGQESARSNQASKFMGTLALPEAPAFGPVITWREGQVVAISKIFAGANGDSDSGGAMSVTGINATGYTHVVTSFKHEGAPTTLTPSDSQSSTGWTSLTRQDHANGDLSEQMFWAKIAGTPGAGYSVTMTPSASRPYRGMNVWLVDSESGEVVQVAVAGATGNGTAHDLGSLSTGGVSTVSFMAIAPYNGGTWSGLGGWTGDQNGSINGTTTFGGSRGAETTDPIDPSATFSTSTDWAGTALTLAESAGASAASLPRPPSRNLAALLQL